jgi:hypothetical protein
MEYPICDANESVLTDKEKKLAKMNLPPSSLPPLTLSFLNFSPRLPPPTPTPPTIPSSQTLTSPPPPGHRGRAAGYFLQDPASVAHAPPAPPSAVTAEAGRPRVISRAATCRQSPSSPSPLPPTATMQPPPSPSHQSFPRPLCPTPAYIRRGPSPPSIRRHPRPACGSVRPRRLGIGGPPHAAPGPRARPRVVDDPPLPGWPFDGAMMRGEG